jgi:hypothetical protein
MKFQSIRNMAVFASVIVSSVIPSQAFAQTDVLTGLSIGAGYTNGYVVSSYKFEQSMILNSIGFVSGSIDLTAASYTLNGTEVNLLDNLDPVDSDGLKWHNFANGGIYVNASSVLEITTRSKLFVPPASFNQAPYYGTQEAGFVSNNPSSNVTYNGSTSTTSNVTNSNLRVSNPGSNVAPEPGSIALLLTGGGALAGIALRRRRNAA